MFNGKRLLMIRSVRGLSRADLGRESGVHPKLIAQLENGDRNPVDSEVDPLALALKVSPSFFEGVDAPAYDRGQASFRARSTLSARTVDSALAMMSIAHLISEWFDRSVLEVPVSIPDLSGETPEQAAEILRAEWGLGQKGINNVIHVLETKGVRVFPVDHMASNMDAFCGWLGNRPAVFLRRGSTGARCRFDACHELGHLVLHKGRNWSKDADEMESEADAFAAAFLMPFSAVVALVRPNASLLDLVAMKAYWKVSVSALNRRLRDMGIFNQHRYIENVKEISRRGWKKAEPSDVPFEGSLVWNKAIDHVGRTGSSISIVAQQIGLDESDVERMLTTFVTTKASHLSVSPGKGNGHIGWARDAKLIPNHRISSVMKNVGDLNK